MDRRLKTGIVFVAVLGAAVISAGYMTGLLGPAGEPPDLASGQNASEVGLKFISAKRSTGCPNAQFCNTVNTTVKNIDTRTHENVTINITTYAGKTQIYPTGDQSGVERLGTLEPNETKTVTTHIDVGTSGGLAIYKNDPKCTSKTYMRMTSDTVEDGTFVQRNRTTEHTKSACS